MLTVTSHAHGEAFLQPTVLASVPMVLGHLAVLPTTTRVSQLLPDGSLEEALTAFATDGAIMTT